MGTFIQKTSSSVLSSLELFNKRSFSFFFFSWPGFLPSCRKHKHPWHRSFPLRKTEWEKKSNYEKLNDNKRDLFYLTKIYIALIMCQAMFSVVFQELYLILVTTLCKRYCCYYFRGEETDEYPWQETTQEIKRGSSEIVVVKNRQRSFNKRVSLKCGDARIRVGIWLWVSNSKEAWALHLSTERRNWRDQEAYCIFLSVCMCTRVSKSSIHKALSTWEVAHTEDSILSHDLCPGFPRDVTWGIWGRGIRVKAFPFHLNLYFSPQNFLQLSKDHSFLD